MHAGIIAFVSFLFLLFLTPIILMEIMVIALYKLGIPPVMGLLIVFGIFVGSFINIPLKRYQIKQQTDMIQPLLFGLNYNFPRRITEQTERVIAINVGGGVIPLLVVGYELVRLTYQGALFPTLAAILINIAACYVFSLSVRGIGILIPTFFPGILAALCGLLLYPENPPAVAVCAGVLGPVIGADLLKFRQINEFAMGWVSIGGAGTFDGIVISAFIALLLI